MIKHLSIFSALILALFFTVAGLAEIKNIYGVRFCNGVPMAVQGQTVTLSIYGPWVDHASNQSGVSGSGVTITRFYGRKAGFSPAVKLDIQVGENAAPGNRVVTLRYPLGEDSFTLKVVAKPLIDRVTKPTFSRPFKNDVVIDLRGSGLRNVKVVPGIRTDQVKIRNAIGREISSARITSVEEISNTDTIIKLRLGFDKELTQVHLAFEFKNDNGCGGVFSTAVLGGTNVPNKSVTLTAPTRPNFVKEISFPAGNVFQVGRSATFKVVLERPAAALTRPTIPGGTLPSDPAGEVIYWKLQPVDAFKSGSTRYNPSGFNRLVIENGQQSAQIKVRVKKRPGNGKLGTAKASILTWRINRNSNKPPEFKSEEFTIGR